MCEMCGKEIKPGEDYYVTEDCSLHEKCYPQKRFIAEYDIRAALSKALLPKPRKKG